MAIRLTGRAAEQVKSDLAGRGGGIGIRVMVLQSECSGMTYRLEFVDEATEEDAIFESEGARIFVDPKSLVWLDGTLIDYLEIGDESGFSFSNPNVTNSCGCGESFYV